MSFEALQERLAALQETTSQLRELIDRLANLEFQPGSAPLGSSISSLGAGDDDGDDDGSRGWGGGDNVGAALSAEISQVLREEEEDLELLHEEILDLRPGRPGSEAEHNKARLKDGVARLEQELRSCRVSFRKAQITAKKSLSQARRQERAVLLASYAIPPTPPAANSPRPESAAAGSPPAAKPLIRRPRQAGASSADGAPVTNEERTVGASTDVTAALRRAHDMMASELAHSTFARQTLDESTAALRQLDAAYTGLDGMLASSRDLLGTLLRSQKTDTWYLETAFYMLLGTLAWLVFRRWLYGPLWWVVWVPLRMLWGTGKAVGRTGSGLLGGGTGASMGIMGGGGEARTVRMGEPEAVPTMRVGRDLDQHGPADGADKEGSMIEEVGKVVDGRESNVDGGNEEDASQPNPMKRMWEEENTAREGEARRVRDEL